MVGTHRATGARPPADDPHASLRDAYRRYGPALLRKAERILQNADDASDIVQGLFVDLMHKRKPELDLRYLYRAVGNRCLNHLRDAGNRRRLLERQQPALRGGDAPGGDQVLTLDLLCKLVGKLDARGQEILLCRYWDDMTQEEIAELLGTSRKTVGKRLGKIRGLVEALTALADATDTTGAKAAADTTGARGAAS